MNKISVAQTVESTKKPTNPNRQKAEQINDSPVKILYKPRAPYPQSFDGGTVCIQGTVTLKVQFLDTGKIGEIKVISGLPYGANENAIEAAKKMGFEPAIKDGKTVTSVKVVQFPITIY
ncbi:MAG TPA: TonB family protein [Pyrinomonadaceae bacterium]|nr:TonB family protein [Pyrinomonadaceae bacterium]